jgi:tetratricopeptide (TPR) repeat protein
MKSRTCLLLILVTLVFSAVTLAWGAATQTSTHARSAAAGQLRREFYAQDFSRVAEDGKQMLPLHPNDLELRAWYVVGAKLPFSRMTKELDAVVKEMKQSAPGSPWTLLASAALATGDQKENLDLCEKAVATDDANPDVLVLATSLVERMAHLPPNPDGLKKFVAEHKTAYERSANGLSAEAQALNTIATIEKDPKATAAAELADRVLKSDPDNVTVLLLKSGALQKEKQHEAAFELLKGAAKAVPDSYTLHMAYWATVMSLPDANEADQKREIEADATRIFSTVRPSAQIVEMALYQLDKTLPDLKTVIGDLILKGYPDTAAQDMVLYYRANKDLPLAATDQNIAHKTKALEAFIDRPKHYDDRVLRMANATLSHNLTSQENPDLNRLYQVVVAMEGDDAQGITLLADHKSHLTEIEKLATTQLDSEWTELQQAVKIWPEEELKFYMQLVVRHDSASWLNALGWVYFNEGKLDAALSKIEIASKMYPEDPAYAVHLGRIYEAKGDNTKAQQSFEDALSKPYYGEGDHPVVAALRELYVHTHGGETGLDAYMQPILEKDRARRKAVILGERLKPEKPMPPFTLASLDGKKFASEDLKGKLVIVNFWATW